MGLKEEILGLDDRKVEEVEVKEWGGLKVRVAAMSAADRDAWEIGAYEERKSAGRLQNVRAKLVARCLVDDKGERVFSDADIEALGRKSAAALDRLYDVAQRLNALSTAAMKEIEGNSAGAPPAA